MCHVLIIEDEPFIAMNIQTMLEEAGATSFDFAVTEAEAVAAALAHPPGLITSDVNLVEGTGPAAVARIHARLGEMPVIFISATPAVETPSVIGYCQIDSSPQSAAFARMHRPLLKPSIQLRRNMISEWSIGQSIAVPLRKAPSDCPAANASFIRARRLSIGHRNRRRCDIQPLGKAHLYG
jgi:CheY-like chemotaxis protein